MWRILNSNCLPNGYSSVRKLEIHFRLYLKMLLENLPQSEGSFCTV